MSFLSSIFGSSPAAAAGSAAANGVVGIAKGVSDIVEKWAPTDADKVKMQIDVQDSIAKAVNEARSYDPRTASTRPFAEAFNVAVDGFCRLIRPTITVVLIGGVFGWWNLQTKSIDPTVLTWGSLVMGFWFGVRTITQDVPKFITALKAARS